MGAWKGQGCGAGAGGGGKGRGRGRDGEGEGERKGPNGGRQTGGGVLLVSLMAPAGRFVVLLLVLGLFFATVHSSSGEHRSESDLDDFQPEDGACGDQGPWLEVSSW